MEDQFEHTGTLPTPEQLLESTKVTKLVWEANKKNGVEISWKDNTWVGYSKKDGTLEMGMQPVPEEIKKSWGISNFSDEEAKVYILSHENMHHVAWTAFDNPEEFPEIRQLLNSLSRLREHTGMGVSRLGNMKLYGPEGSNTAHEEDVIELMNMYGINPKNLKDYLTWLTTTDKHILDEQKLFKLNSPEISEAFFSQVSMTVAKFLKKSGIVSEIVGEETC